MGTRLLLAGLMTLAVAGCGGGGSSAPKAASPPAPGETKSSAAAERPDDAGDINALLRERATTLELGRARAFASTATGAQRVRDRRAARRAKRLSLERVRFVADELQTSGDRAKISVTLSYRVRGMSRPFRTPRRVEARKTADGWRVTADKPRREPLPWEVASFRVVRTPHVVLLAPDGLDASPLRSGLEDAYREIRRNLPSRDLPRSVLVIAARDAEQAEQLVGRVVKGVVAIANVSVEWGPLPALEVERVLAQRLIVVVSRWRTQDPVGRQGTLVHEMTHTALDPDTSARTPPWLIEGVAMYVANDDRTAEARARAAGAGPTTKLSAISRPNSIFQLNSRDQGAAYAAASAAAEAIAARRGNKGLFELYDAFNDSAIPGRPGARTTDRVMRRTIGMSLAELDAAVPGG
jgi:hypothetical protein